MEGLKRELADTARGLGAALLGVVIPENADRHAGIMVGWTINRPTVRVAQVLESTRSVVVLGYPIWDRSLDLALRRPGGGWSYPGHLLPSLAVRAVRQALTERGHRVNPGYSPICYKKLAVEAGFGIQGKSSLVVNRVYGPNLRIGVVLTDAELPPDKPTGEDLCGECRACVDACPVGALEPHRVDPDRCLVGITLREEGGTVRGQTALSPHAHVMCRLCQDACPYGRFREDEPGWVS